MARGKDLAGLAALGALGMMLSKGKKGADRDTDTGVDVQPSYATRDPLEAANSSQDAIDIRDSLTRGAPGTSETIKPTVTSPRMKTPAVRKPMTGSGGGRGPAAGEAEAYRQSMNRVPSLDTSKVSDVDLTGGAKATNTNMPSSGLKYQSLQDREIEAQAKRRAAGSSFYGTKTMAKGGTTRSSASSRGDGIASRGKTKGRMC